MPYPETAEGFQVKGADSWTQFHKQEFKLKPKGDYDVDVKISACGVCASDVHTISGGWGDQKFPLCVGHEIIGEAIAVGPKVSLIKVGQRVGVGAQCYSCLQCEECRNENETYCDHQLNTYGSEFPNTGGIISQGGYSSHIRAHEHWVFPIPDALETNNAAPMLCAGLTAYSPLVRNGTGPGKRVAILGLGGIGHFGVLFAKALGAETWVISRSHAKEDDAKKLGADGFIATEDADWHKKHARKFDVILNSANSNNGWDFKEYFGLLKVHGRWITVGLPDEPKPIFPGDVWANGALFGTSHLGSRKETIEMLQLAADKNIKTWVTEVKINESNLSETVQKLRKNDVRYRFTLTGYDEAFGKRE